VRYRNGNRVRIITIRIREEEKTRGRFLLTLVKTHACATNRFVNWRKGQGKIV
jgi:hypothetical protein